MYLSNLCSGINPVRFYVPDGDKQSCDVGGKMKHEIKFQCDDSVVWVRIDTDLPSGVGTGKATLWFQHKCDSDIEAELLFRYLKKRHGDAMEQIRKDEFFDGWRHAKAKKHGQQYFDFFLDDFTVGPTWGDE